MPLTLATPTYPNLGRGLCSDDLWHGCYHGSTGHDERDHEFATTFDIPIVEVISGGEKPIEEEAFEGDGVCVNSDFLNGLQVAEAKEKMIACSKAREGARVKFSTGLRDWLFSRQRYWGEPFHGTP